MLEGLIGLLVVLIVVGIIAALIIYLIDMLPIDVRFKQIARVLVILIAVLVILMRALPLLGVAI